MPDQARIPSATPRKDRVLKSVSEGQVPPESQGPNGLEDSG